MRSARRSASDPRTLSIRSARPPPAQAPPRRSAARRDGRCAGCCGARGAGALDFSYSASPTATDRRVDRPRPALRARRARGPRTCTRSRARGRRAPQAGASRWSRSPADPWPSCWRAGGGGSSPEGRGSGAGQNACTILHGNQGKSRLISLQDRRDSRLSTASHLCSFTPSDQSSEQSSGPLSSYCRIPPQLY